MDLKKLIIKFWPLILVVIIWFIFASPYFLKNKVPFSSTYLVNFFSPWNAYPGFSSPVKNNAMPDIITQIYPWKALTIDIFKNFQIPLWNPYSFSGTPILANYQSAVLSPFNLLFFILPFIDAWSILILLQPLLAGIFMYLYVKSLKVSNEASAISSLAFMFCGFITTWMAYGTLGYAILFLPLALYAVEKFYNTKSSKFLILFSFSIPLSLFSGHFQTSIYFLITVFAYIIFKYLFFKNIKDFIWVFIYFLFGLLLSLPQLLPSMELYSQSLRSGIFLKLEVIPWGYLSTFLAPDYFGNPVTRNDWFGHYAEWNAYIGLLPLMLGFYAIFRNRAKEVMFFSVVALLVILFTFQTPLLDLLVFLKIPVLSTSAASRMIVIFSFSMSILAAFGWDKLLNDFKERKIRQVFLWLGVFTLTFLILWAVVILKLFIPLDKVSIAKQNLFLPTIIFIASCIVITVFYFHKKTFLRIFLSAEVLSLVLILIIAFDMLRFSGKWMPFDPKNLVYPKIPVGKEFSNISGSDRVLSNFGGEASIYYKLPSIEGYDAVYLKRYGEFMASLQYGDLEESQRSVVSFPKYGLGSKKAVDLLGIKYIVHKLSDGRSVWTYPFWTYKPGSTTLLYDDGIYQVYENNNSFPRAFLVGKYITESNPQMILDKMLSSEFDLRQEVVLEENPGFKLSTGDSGSAKILDYNPNKVSIQTNSRGDSLLFLSDSYFPGWSATVDGKNSTIYRADFTFRAIFVPKGEHNIVFSYKPLSFIIGIYAALSGLFLMVGLTVLRGRKLLSIPKL